MRSQIPLRIGQHTQPVNSAQPDSGCQTRHGEPHVITRMCHSLVPKIRWVGNAIQCQNKNGPWKDCSFQGPFHARRQHESLREL